MKFNDGNIRYLSKWSFNVSFPNKKNLNSLLYFVESTQQRGHSHKYSSIHLLYISPEDSVEAADA